LEESLLVQAPVQILGPSPGDAAVDVRRCTFALASSCLHLHYRDAPPEGSAPARLTAHDTVWAARDKVLLVNLSRTDALDAPAAALHRRRLLAWAGRGNVYPDGPQLLMHAVNGRVVPITPVTTLEHWRQTWGAAEPGAVQGPVRFTGKELQVRTPGDLDRLRPADFRLASGSAGKGTGEGGRDAGAPVDEVGPGPAYDRWRQSAAYREWRRQSGQPEEVDE
jgi:hypothetical protein